MLKLFNDEIQSNILKKVYRHRFLLKYIVIGFFSIVLELYIFNLLKKVLAANLSLFFAVICGFLFAFFLNSQFNFHIPRPKQIRAFGYFMLISSISFLLNYLFNSKLKKLGLSYELSRLLSSGLLFFIGYIAHRKFSFKEYKQVGVAIYAHEHEDIKRIWEKIRYVNDFIHIDIVDESFNPQISIPTTFRLETVRAYWPHKEMHCHIMSKQPSRWIDKVLLYADTIIIHSEIDEDVQLLLHKIKTAKKRASLCIMQQTPLTNIEKYLSTIDELMLLTIDQPGQSGQKFNSNALERIEAINKLKNRNNFTVCVDGGVNSQIISLLKVERVISGSYVLNADKPFTQIMRLQTSNEYEIDFS